LRKERGLYHPDRHLELVVYSHLRPAELGDICTKTIAEGILQFFLVLLVSYLPGSLFLPDEHPDHHSCNRNLIPLPGNTSAEAGLKPDSRILLGIASITTPLPALFTYTALPL
jgi:hypothetical protein